MNRYNTPVWGLFFVTLMAFGCESSKSVSGSREPKDYSQYTTMVQVLQSVRGLRVMGSGAGARVFMSGYNTVNATNKQPLFVVDGVVIGSSVADLDRLMTPIQVRSVRTIRGMQATSRYGDQGQFGVVLIKTINADNTN